MVKLVIFDWDDVFTLGSKEGYFACYHSTLEAVGVKLSPKVEEERIKAKWGKSHIEELRELLKEYPEKVKAASTAYEQALFDDVFINNLRVLNGVSSLLQRLTKKYILTIATGMHPQFLQDIIMPKFGIPNVFRQIVSAYDIDDPAKQKPHPYAAELILAQQNISASDAVLVGDAAGDVALARAANIEPIVVLTGHLTRQEAMNLGVTKIIKDVRDIESVLRRK